MKQMKDVAKELNIPIETIRYYERIGLLAVARDDRGYRQFDEQTIAWLQLLKWLRKSGMSIKNLQTYVGMVLEGDTTISERKALLTKRRDELLAQLKEQEEVVEVLSAKIASYDDHLLRFEKEKLKK